MSIENRITLLRNLMQSLGIDAFLIFGTDPHLSEYVPNAWRSREWISGFTGSYGKVAITRKRAVLWTDSRYFIQAESQLAGSGIGMIKDRQADTISIDNWLIQELKPGSIVALDGLTISAAEVGNLEKKLNAQDIRLMVNTDLISPIWEQRPSQPDLPVCDYPVLFAGRSRSEKLAQIRSKLIECNAHATIICQLDDLAWTFNLRGNDILYNPLFMGYGYVDQQQAILFVTKGKVSEDLNKTLKREGVTVSNYDSIFLTLDKLPPYLFYVDPNRTNSVIYRTISQRCPIFDGIAIPTLLKSVKNEVEIAGMREAHRRDGMAIVNFLFWFNKHIGKKKITERSIAEKLIQYRSEQAHFMGESFSSTVAFGPHGAIVHYSASEETDVEILPDGILLFDSGGQYLDGTTDITRTIATGKISIKQQTDFTLVLKGMIQLAMAVFPENTGGYTLDIIARKALWDKGLNYGHGTGHGVGHYLSVHEGPMAIRQEYNGEPIREGQILSDEPGLYREGEYGIRIENVLVCRKELTSDFGRFLSFDTLTLCPIDRKLISRDHLTAREQKWLNFYHDRVFAELSPGLNPDVRKWLETRCATL
jgi:Xaa-Pro aminopeptidase